MDPGVSGQRNGACTRNQRRHIHAGHKESPPMTGEAAENRAIMEYHARSRSALLAYLLWFFLGFAGAHRMYAARVPTGILQLLVHGLGWLTTPILVGWVFIALWAVWWVIDAILIPGWIRDYNLDVAQRISVSPDAA
jgi:TM2 domain-containing membrane protein YozV